jgi:hypothetical protein
MRRPFIGNQLLVTVVLLSLSFAENASHQSMERPEGRPSPLAADGAGPPLARKQRTKAFMRSARKLSNLKLEDTPPHMTRALPDNTIIRQPDVCFSPNFLYSRLN